MLIHYWWQWLLIVVGLLVILAYVFRIAWKIGYVEGWNSHLVLTEEELRHMN